MTNARLSGSPRLRDDWPHTRRVVPWLIAVLLVMIYIVPFDSISLPIHLPINSNLDRFVLGGSFLVWLAVVLAGRSDIRLRRSPMNVAICVFVGICILSIAVNLRSLTWDGELTLSLKEFSLAGSYIALFYICSTTIRSTEVLAFARLLVCLAVITAVGTIYQYRTGTNPFFQIASTIFGGAHVVSAAVGSAAVSASAAGVAARPAITGPTIHPLADTTLMASAIPFSLAFAAAARRQRELLGWLVAMLVLAGGCVATDRKTALIVPLVSILVLVVYQPRRYTRFWPVLVVAVLLVEVITPHALSRLIYQVGHASSGSSTTTRTADYPAVVPFVLSHLLVGRGYGSFDPTKYRILDDQMLGWLIEIGVLGALSYLGLMGAAIASAHRVARRGIGVGGNMMQAVVAVVAGFAISNFFYDTFGFRQAPYVFFFVAALGIAYSSAHPEPEPVRVPEDREKELTGGGSTHATAEHALDTV
jgi:hypothetical protein